MKTLTIFCKLGFVLVSLNDNKIVNISLIREKSRKIPPPDSLNVLSKFEKKIVNEFNRYFNKELVHFNFPIEYPKTVTDFQKLVLENVRKIEYGKYKTYKDIACEIGNEFAFRAVGNTLNKNPFPIVIPCHRVIGANGALKGFSAGVSWKKYLLKLEGII